MKSTSSTADKEESSTRTKCEKVEDLAGDFINDPTDRNRLSHALSLLPFALLDFIIATGGFERFGLPLRPTEGLEALRPVLLTANIAVGVFAVNFSLAAFRLSRYRQVAVQNVTAWLAALSTTILFVALAPVGVAASYPGWTGTLSALTLPVLGYLSLSLGRLIYRELAPSTIIARYKGARSWGESARALQKRGGRAEDKAPELTDGTEERVSPPTHEVGWQPTFRLAGDDPLTRVSRIATKALREEDTEVFEDALETLLAGVGRMHGSTEKLPSVAFETHVSRVLRHVAGETIRHDASGLHTSMLSNRVSDFLGNMKVAGRRDMRLYFQFSSALREVVPACLEAGDTQGALAPLICFRRAHWHAARAEPSGEHVETNQFEYALQSFPRFVQRLGERAIVDSEEEYLYRCLEALGWMGCSAVRKNRHYSGRAAANGLVQLGRISRANQIACFGDRCSSPPEDHAEERLVWMGRCAGELEDDDLRENWLGAIAEALSRLRGTKMQLTGAREGGEWKLKVTGTKKPHVSRMAVGARSQVVNYSDEAETQELVLY